VDARVIELLSKQTEATATLLRVAAALESQQEAKGKGNR
jgi:hypothetical protein